MRTRLLAEAVIVPGSRRDSNQSEKARGLSPRPYEDDDYHQPVAPEDPLPTHGVVASLAVDDHHRFAKPRVERATFIAGIGIEGDAHSGATVQHRSRLAQHADSPNLRQVHLIDTGLLERLHTDGFDVRPGELGENVTVDGIDVSAVGVGSIIELGEQVVLAVTGRRNPCGQVNDLGPGLQARLLEGHQGRVDGGAMAVVVHGGVVEIGALVAVTAPTRHRPLQRV